MRRDLLYYGLGALVLYGAFQISRLDNPIESFKQGYNVASDLTSPTVLANNTSNILQGTPIGLNIPMTGINLPAIIWSNVKGWFD